MVRDQFLTSCLPEVKVFLRKKGHIPNSAVAKAADIYKSAHRTSANPSKSHGRNDAGKGKSNHSLSKSRCIPKCYLCGKPA